MSADEHRERYLSALSEILSGGLWVDDAEDAKGCNPEAALMRGMGALLKAVTLAKFNAPDGCDLGAEGWTPHSTDLSDVETHEALRATTAILRGAPVVMDELRMRDEFRSSHERSDCVEYARREHVRLVGETEIERKAAAAPAAEGSAES